MADRSEKKAQAEERAREIYARLMALKGDRDLSNNDWCRAAGLNTSFFTALKGGDNKSPSEPSIGNLRAILQAVNSSIPEFFADEAQRRLVPIPDEPALTAMFSGLLKGVGLDEAADKYSAPLARRLPKALEKAAALQAQTDHESQTIPRRPHEPRSQPDRDSSG